MDGVAVSICEAGAWGHRGPQGATANLCAGAGYIRPAAVLHDAQGGGDHGDVVIGQRTPHVASLRDHPRPGGPVPTPTRHRPGHRPIPNPITKAATIPINPWRDRYICPLHIWGGCQTRSHRVVVWGDPGRPLQACTLSRPWSLSDTRVGVEGSIW